MALFISKACFLFAHKQDFENNTTRAERQLTFRIGCRYESGKGCRHTRRLYSRTLEALSEGQQEGCGGIAVR